MVQQDPMELDFYLLVGIDFSDIKFIQLNLQEFILHGRLMPLDKITKMLKVL